MQEYTVKADPEETGKRLDVFLSRYFKDIRLGYSRNFIQRLIREGGVTLGGVSLKPHHKVKSGEEFCITVNERKARDLEPREIALDVVYEDDELAVINKPCGMVVHPGAGREQDSLASGLLCRFKKLSDVNPERPGIVHRLDKDTSGLLVVAKTNPVHLELARQFAEHSIKRKYLALVEGKMEFDENVIEAPIGRHPTQRKSMAVNFSAGARYAKTYYRTLERLGGFSLVELEPFTGRTHQLRVHLAYIGHPVLGDAKYGKRGNFRRLALHAVYLGFTHPVSGRSLEFRCDMPAEFKEYLHKTKTPVL